jgi:hypothetical protein
MKTFLRWLVASVAVGLPVSSALGQYFVQQGNVLDANTRLGSGGLNYSNSRSYQINSTNRLITGNSTGGTSFRGYSPVRDSNQLFLGTTDRSNSNLSNLFPGSYNSPGVLPSDRLTSFRRDSYGISDPRLQSGTISTPTPYYSQTSTVLNAWQIARGYNDPGRSQLRSNYMALNNDFRPQQQNPLQTYLSSGGGQPLQADTRLVRAETGSESVGQYNRRLLGSPLFGNVRELKMSQVAADTDLAGTNATAARATTGENKQPAPRTDRLVSPDQATQQGSQETQGLPANQTTPLGATDSRGKTDAQLRKEVTGEGSSSSTLARSIAPPAPGPMPQAPIGWRNQIQVTQEPLKTFVGTQDERLKEQLALAEGLLRKQQYYDAARRYEMAHAIDLTNPLPMFGRALSLLAAGDYVSSSNDLFMAIQSAGPQVAVRIDIKQFVPDLTVLDRRRAFLEQRLETFDDFRLRFLLGWAEHMSGLTEDGLTNMRKAAEAAPKEMDSLRQFVKTLSVQPATRPG